MRELIINEHAFVRFVYCGVASCEVLAETDIMVGGGGGGAAGMGGGEGWREPIHNATL